MRHSLLLFTFVTAGLLAGRALSAPASAVTLQPSETGLRASAGWREPHGIVVRRIGGIPAAGLGGWKAAPPGRAANRQMHPTGLRVEIDGRLFTEYVVKGTPRPYLYPIVGAAGESVVRDFPMRKGVPGEERFLNEPHHRSLWFAHGSINGINFWSEYLVFGRQEHAGFSDLKTTGSRGSFIARTKWIAPNGETTLTDERSIAITALPEGEWTLDFAITLKASEEELLIGDTKEGTMALRLCPSLSLNSSKSGIPTGPSTGHAFNSNGDRDRDVWGKRANWVCYYGPDPKGNAVGVVMFSHPDNLRSPTTWHARDYGLLAANPFGLHDFEPNTPAGAGNYTIKKGGSLTLRYLSTSQRANPTRRKSIRLSRCSRRRNEPPLRTH